MQPRNGMDMLSISRKLENEPCQRRLRAIVEVVGGELAIYPIADCDTDAATILDALRFVIADGVGR